MEYGVHNSAKAGRFIDSYTQYIASNLRFTTTYTLYIVLCGLWKFSLVSADFGPAAGVALENLALASNLSEQVRYTKLRRLRRKHSRVKSLVGIELLGRTSSGLPLRKRGTKGDLIPDRPRSFRREQR